MHVHDKYALDGQQQGPLERRKGEQGLNIFYLPILASFLHSIYIYFDEILVE